MSEIGERAWGNEERLTAASRYFEALYLSARARKEDLDYELLNRMKTVVDTHLSGVDTSRVMRVILDRPKPIALRPKRNPTSPLHIRERAAIGLCTAVVTHTGTLLDVSGRAQFISDTTIFLEGSHVSVRGAVVPVLHDSLLVGMARAIDAAGATGEGGDHALKIIEAYERTEVIGLGMADRLKAEVENLDAVKLHRHWEAGTKE